MHKVWAAAISALMVITLRPNVASAQAPVHNWTKFRVTVGIGPEGHRVIVTTNFEKTGANPLITSYGYNPIYGTVNHLPTPMENVNPNSGIGVVVKRSSASGMLAVLHGPDAQGTWAIDPASTPAGNYEIVVTVPARIISPRDPQSGLPGAAAPGTSSATNKMLPKQPMLLTFHVVVDANGNMTMDPKMPPGVKPAPATQ